MVLDITKWDVCDEGANRALQKLVQDEKPEILVGYGCADTKLLFAMQAAAGRNYVRVNDQIKQKCAASEKLLYIGGFVIATNDEWVIHELDRTRKKNVRTPAGLTSGRARGA